MRVDLHLHSTASDGSLAPAALVAAAVAGGLDIIALTDHDTAAGVPEASAAAVGSLHVIPGIEVSTTHEGADLHMLGYFVDPGHPGLTAHERAAVDRRRERMIAILDGLRAQGIDVALEAVVAAAGEARTVARPHLARALVEQGHARTVSDAFDRFIGDASPAFRTVDLVSPRAAIDRIHAAGGIAVWAHPDVATFRRELRRFTQWGLDGVECFRPRNSAAESLALEEAARAAGLLVTGGSDWHGVWSGPLGAFSLERDDIAAFLERGGI